MPAPTARDASARGVSLGSAVGLCVAAAGLAIGLRPLADNSYFTHLATGRLILDQGSVPSVDPYTFTAPSDPWVVQSWLASVLYATAEQLAGGLGLRIVSGAVAAALALLVWRLTQGVATLIPRLLIAALAVGVGGELWGERPFMLGLVALAVVVLAAEDGLDPRWLFAVGVIWVNVHGSFPLGLGYLVVVAVGRRLDGEPWEIERRCAMWAAGGMVLGGLGPLGPKLLLFPLELVQRQEVLRTVTEWRAPLFEMTSQRLFLVQVALAVVLLVRRPTYRSGLVIAVFATAAMLGARNITVASIVLLPGMAAAAPSLGTLRSDARSQFARGLAVVGASLVVLVGVSRLGEPHFRLREYPVDAVAFLEVSEVDLEEHHLAAPDIVGNFVELLYGPGGRVFYDDRFDMFPDDVWEAHLSLVRSSADLRAQLSSFDIDLVLWERAAAVAPRLVLDPEWRVLYSDERWMVSCRRGSALGGTVGTC